GSCGSTLPAASTTSRTRASSPGSKPPASTSTARSSPTSPCTIRPRSARWSRSRARRSRQPEPSVPALGPRHHRVRRLRDLIRDPRARRAEHAFVVEGPRVVEAALDRDAELQSTYIGPGAARAFASLVGRLRALGVPIEELKEGVLERIGDTVTPQPVLAVASTTRAGLDDLGADGLVLVAVTVRDPGNAGTLLRSAEAAGASGVVFCG